MDQGNLEFREDAADYIVLTVIHIKYLAIFANLFGLVVVVAIFGCGFAFFPWALYDTSFDVIALFGFFIFVISGITVHWLALYSIHATKYRLMIPVIIFHSFIIALEGITVLIAIGELVANQNVTMDENDLAARYVLITNPISILYGVLMIYIVVRAKFYVRNKHRHIRNGLPPPVMEVSREVVFFRNKIFSTSENSSSEDASNARSTDDVIIETSSETQEKQTSH
ncbi:unnamed protein product [Auanema sp. JU1783]|nr:unnamed protein product [Auanema sp. JU1783]